MSENPQRVLIGGLFHETHTFLVGETPLEECHILRGEELFRARGDASPLGGTLDVATECGWHVVPAIDLRATPGPVIPDSVFESWWTDFEAALRNALKVGLDGIFLVLHGAMVCLSERDVEGEVLERIRALAGTEIPIGGVTDLHANFSPRMAAQSSALVTYRCNPHTDARETAMRAAHLLDFLMQTKNRATTVFEQTPLLWAPTVTGTGNEPMRGLEALAREIETTHPDILAVNVHAGYSFADTHDSGVSFSAVTIGDGEVAKQQLEHLSRTAMASRECAQVLDPPLSSVMPKLKELLESSGNGPILLVEPSDNIGGGAPGDGTHVLRTLLEHEIEGAAVVINDPKSVELLSALPLGTHIQMPIGGNSGALSGGPLDLNLELLSLSDGRFELEDRHSHLASISGLHIEMGPCAVVKCNGVRVLLTSLKTPPFDLGQLRSQGIEPEGMSVIGVKAAVAHRQAYDPIARASFTIATPGPCTSELKTLPWQHIRRPIYSLDTL